MNLVEHLSKLSPEQRKLLELKLQQQGIAVHQIPISQEYRKNYEYFPLSMEQEPMWVVEKYDPNNPFYEIPGTVMMAGSLDIKLLERSTNEVIKRHEILRAVFIIHDDKPVQYILPSLTLPLQRIDFKDLPVDEQEHRLKELREDRGLYAFDLARGPLIKTLLVELGNNKYVFITIMHHIIGDLLSLKLFLKEAAWFYVTFSQGAPGYDLPGLPIQYVDYACWEQHWFRESIIGSEARKKQEAFWLDMYGDEAPIVNLPFDFPRPPVKQYEGDHLYFVLKEEEIAALKAIVLKENATLYVILFTIFYIFLAKITGQEDIVVGTPVNTRQSAVSNNMIGLFVKTAALRNYPQGRKTFRNFLTEVNHLLLEVYKNQDYQYEELVRKILKKRDPSRNPLFDVLFNFIYIAVDDIAMPGLKVTPYRFKTNRIGFDLELVCEGTYKELRLKLSYCTKLFKQETALRFVSYLKKITAAVIQDPDVKLSGIDIIPGEERKRILIEFNDTAAGYPEEKTIFELFETQALKTPDHTAVVFEDQRLTYRELDEKSSQLAWMLREKGVGPDVIVGLMVERSLEMLTGIMGILKAGGAYLPMDPDYPQERIDYMLKDSGAKLLVTTNNLEELPNLLTSQLHNFHLSPATSLAYVIYTSGSTGRPKGVMVEHSSVVNVLSALQAAYPLNESDTYLLKTSYIFDVSAAELFGWFRGGGRLAVLKAGGEKDPGKILEIIEQQCVTHINFVPSMFSVFVEHVEQAERKNIARLSGLKYIFLAGETLLPGLVKRFGRLDTGIAVENIYGPTETAIYSSWYSLSHWDGKGGIPIGTPMPNIRLYVLDRAGGLQPIGIPGELCIAGAGIARGYLNNPELTAEKFKEYRSYKTYRTYILYKTGDVARWLEDGNIEFLGRVDLQVKIRGFRVELGEIERRLLNHPEVKETVVIARVDKNRDKSLCAYIVPDKKGKKGTGAGLRGLRGLREYLAKSLPDYMVPSYFVVLERIPLTANGKIDRSALPVPEQQAGEGYMPPQNNIEKELVKIWSEILELEQDTVGINDNFFKRGGHSLKAAVMIYKVHRVFNIKLPLAEVFKTPSVRGLAEYIRGLAVQAVHRYTSIKPVEKRDYYVLSSAQERLYILQQVDPESTAYNMPVVIPLASEADVERLEKAFIGLIERHESLRTSFHMIANEPVQRINEENYKLQITNYNQITNHKLQITNIIENFVRFFDLAKAPLLRIGFIHTPGDKHILLVDMHHIVSDGISQQVLTRGFMALYTADKASLPRLLLQYKDYALWQNSGEMQQIIKQQEEYWLKQFEEGAPMLELPTDFARDQVQGYEGSVLEFFINEENTRVLKTMALNEDATLYMILLALFNILLAKLSGQQDIVVGTIVAGRGHPDLESIIGVFINTLALRNFPAGEKTFTSFLGEVRDRTLKSFENQDYPFEELVHRLQTGREGNRNPVFDVLFSFQTIEMPQQEIPGVEKESLAIEAGISKFDLTLDGCEKGETIHLFFEYSTRLFDKETISLWADCFKEIVSEVITNSKVKLKDITLPHHLVEIKTDTQEQRKAFGF